MLGTIVAAIVIAGVILYVLRIIVSIACDDNFRRSVQMRKNMQAMAAQRNRIRSGAEIERQKIQHWKMKRANHG